MSNPHEPDVTSGPATDAPNTPPLAASAVSWSAVLAGAATAAALSLILLILGVGLGLSSVSPWAGSGISATTFEVSTILWVTLTQLIAAGMGGYFAGRMRVRWIGVHTDEVYFRDTAHGFLAWSVATLATATLLTSVIGSITGGDAQARVSVVGERGAAITLSSTLSGAAQSEATHSGSDSGPLGYFIDSLFRSDPGTAHSAGTKASGSAVSGSIAEPASAASLAEVTRIFMHAIPTEGLPDEDVRYVGQLLARHTGLAQQDGEMRVAGTYARLKATLHDADTATRTAADAARKATAYGSLWLFVSLLSGAFVASLAATFGGRQRDA